MKIRFFIIFFFTALTILFIPSFYSKDIVHGQNVAGDVVINEIMWMGSSLDSLDEWVELRNMTSNTIDLSGWVVEKLGSGLGENITLPEGSLIVAGGFFVIGDHPAATSILSQEPNYQTGSISLTNTGEQLILKDSEGTTIDTANGTSTWHAGSNATQKASMERNATPSDGTSADNWHTATAATNLDAGVTDLATPGAANSTPTVVSPTLTPTPSLSETPTPTSTTTPTPTTIPTETPTTTPSPTPSPTITPTNTPTPLPSATPVPTLTPTPTPGVDVPAQCADLPLDGKKVSADQAGAIIFGTDKSDLIITSDWSDIVFGKGGSDCIVTANGNDIVFASGGDDVILAGDGNDIVFADGGNDIVSGDNGIDMIFGSTGTDTCTSSEQTFGCEL